MIPDHAMKTVKYGVSEDQAGDLYLPEKLPAPVVCLLHGGFWRMPYGRDEFAAIANDLVTRGYAIWNIEYRRLGVQGGGWPGTLHDVISAINHLAAIVAGGIELDLNRVIVVGHSAGGHLALWVAKRNRPSPIFSPLTVQPIAAAGLAAITDLVRASELNAGRGAVNEFLGGSNDQYRDRFAVSSPIEIVPLGVMQLIMHGGKDEALPMELSRQYVSAARSHGDTVEFIELSDAGHMDFLDPESRAHTLLCRWLAALV